MKRRALRSAAHSAGALRRQAIQVSGAPPSVAAIIDQGFIEENEKASVAIRQVGCTRRVFLLDPFLNTDEIEGLAYRIRTLTKNDALNSVLIATDDTDDSSALPSSLVDRDYPYWRDESVDPGLPPAPGQTWHVAGGYDPLEALYRRGYHRNPAHNKQVTRLLHGLTDLALAMRGDPRDTKIPTIAMPHGAVHDGGFAVACSASYVLATRETSFAIRHPRAGLALDPVGLSYVLPRLGREFDQPAAKFAGCGMILGLMGYQADAEDMLETGLATHYIESPAALGTLEHALSEIRPWNQQALLKLPVRYHGDPEPMKDHNAEYRNTAVAHAIHCFTDYRADGTDMWVCNENDHTFDHPSLDFNMTPWHEERGSTLVNYAATFDEIFKTESTLLGIQERFREVAMRHTTDPEVQEGIDVAKDFCLRLEKQSPLALSAVYRLLKAGAEPGETLQRCMAREERVQIKLIGMSDFEKWAKFASDPQNEKSQFSSWKHKSIADVTNDEVEELLAE